MATYVLIAGAWHGSWCWVEVVRMLEAAGHRVLTPNLLGTQAEDEPETTEPLQRWAEQIADIVRQEVDEVVLVGHSRAGLVISEVAERVPEKIDLLVYLAAYLLQDGQTLNDWAQRALDADAMTNAVAFHSDGTCTIKPEFLEKIFYNRTSAHFIDFARARTVPEPIAAFMSPIQISQERFGSVRHGYIECLQDQAIPLDMQKAMQAPSPNVMTVQLDCDHSPFFSMPHELVSALEKFRRAE
ncbi:alpha/beta fold hydrolase [Rhizobium ruizarguesonis]|uniref:alpha/beta fold hydrolase n=1 Tax=Rhizobium ruizarguesonis TaxID=2081791 RepID=UPI0004774DBE|nr:alpha/beta fold hydrolase [Rhizobium ruizarguesonis]TAY85884.1 alpha/beta fold hydrolase [Rhizobium ruizarguesonis]TBA33849.1 alpha/beta fold hydrolase [Rhizobium ruizarguesonis]TBB61418.1 alpha/beta fold hydrolase [Rhizobium ruizarguesonis]TBB85253.1 alpha/beta fold hydrolase [Rhizobium ruizarguesonis]